VCVVAADRTDTSHLLHCVGLDVAGSRIVPPAWTPWEDVERVAGTARVPAGRSERWFDHVACRAYGDDVHVCAVKHGSLFHTVRGARGSWMWLIDVEPPAGSLLSSRNSSFSDVALVPGRATAAPPTSQVPDVRLLSRSEAAEMLRAARLVPPFSGGDATGHWVWRQRPAPGAVVDAGSTVTCQLRPPEEPGP
jgi:hypothetical protein